MKKFTLSILVILLIISCTREDQKTTCYEYYNNTQRTCDLEFYSYNGGRITTLIQSARIVNEGLLIEKCQTEEAVIGPVQMFRFDSIVVKFDNSRKLTYLSRYAQGFPGFLFQASDYLREDSTNNFSHTFTEDDYNNAIPY